MSTTRHLALLLGNEKLVDQVSNRTSDETPSAPKNLKTSVSTEVPQVDMMYLGDVTVVFIQQPGQERDTEK